MIASRIQISESLGDMKMLVIVASSRKVDNIGSKASESER